MTGRQTDKRTDWLPDGHRAREADRQREGETGTHRRTETTTEKEKNTWYIKHRTDR